MVILYDDIGYVSAVIYYSKVMKDMKIAIIVCLCLSAICFVLGIIGVIKDISVAVGYEPTTGHHESLRP